MKKKNIGFFGGTFDPIHFGHLELAISLLEKHSLDEVWFSPAYISPFKEETKATPEQRKTLALLAISDIPHFKLVDWELKRKSPSYTIDTIRHLITENPGASFNLLLGEDTAKTIGDWKESTELLKLAPPLIGERKFNISSTELRERLHHKKYCGHLIPTKTLDYIHKHKIY